MRFGIIKEFYITTPNVDDWKKSVKSDGATRKVILINFRKVISFECSVSERIWPARCFRVGYDASADGSGCTAVVKKV